MCLHRISTRYGVVSSRLRGIGQREYLVIQPLAPAAPEPLAARAAEAVKILDELGLVIRLT